jgi:hypothetical protein
MQNIIFKGSRKEFWIPWFGILLRKWGEKPYKYILAFPYTLQEEGDKVH